MCHQNTEISFYDLLPSATKGNITIEKDFTGSRVWFFNMDNSSMEVCSELYNGLQKWRYIRLSSWHRRGGSHGGPEEEDSTILTIVINDNDRETGILLLINGFC